MPQFEPVATWMNVRSLSVPKAFGPLMSIGTSDDVTGRCPNTPTAGNNSVPHAWMRPFASSAVAKELAVVEPSLTATPFKEPKPPYKPPMTMADADAVFVPLPSVPFAFVPQPNSVPVALRANAVLALLNMRPSLALKGSWFCWAYSLSLSAVMLMGFTLRVPMYVRDELGSSALALSLHDHS